jgi:hypothetical protein
MTAATTIENAPKPAMSRQRRPRHSVPLASGSSREAKRLAAVILEVFAGVRTLPQAAEALEMSLTRYYYLEARAMQGLLKACEPRPRGPQANPQRELAAIRRENERLRQDLGRQQSLVRTAQRTIGLNPPPPPPKPATKASGKKSRKRKPVVRALSLATRLQQEATEPEAPSDNGMSPAPVA